MKTAAIYARYSSDNQTEQSIEGQIRVCQEYAQKNHLLVVETYIDRAMTGTNDLRPDFQRMIRDSAKKQWDFIIVYKLDRFSRDKYEATIHKHTLKENGIKLLSAMENIPDSPEGIILESLLEGMNQYYSAELSQKVRRGLTESYIKGNYTGGLILYGYDVVNMKNVPNPEESVIVQEIFTKYAQGFTASSIAKELRERGIRTKQGRYVNETKIYKILINSKYNGRVKHGDKVYDNIFPKLVDDDTWQKVQEIHQANKHAPSRKKDIYDYILSGKLVCGDCKRLMVGESGTSHTGEKHYYYTCLSRRRHRQPCTQKAISKQYLEDMVINATWKLFSQENCVEEIAEQLCKLHEQESKNNTNLKSLEQRRATALKASNNLISAIEQGIITEQTKQRLKELETQISQLDFDIEQEKQRAYSYLSKDDIRTFLKNAVCGDLQDMNIRKLLVNTFVREVIYYKSELIITYNFTDERHRHDITQKSVREIEEQSEKAAPFLYKSSNILTPSAPRANKNEP